MRVLRKRGTCILLVIVASIVVASLLPMEVHAQAASGTWTSRIKGEGAVDSTWPVDFHYDAVLNIGNPNTLKLTYSRIVENQPGWADQSMVGTSNTVGIASNAGNGQITLTILIGPGYQLTFDLSADAITGTDSYVDNSGVTNTWTFDLVRGSQLVGIDVSWFGATAVGVALMGALVAILTSAFPGPRLIQPTWGPGHVPKPQGPPQFQQTPYFGAYHQVPSDAPVQFPPNWTPPGNPLGTRCTTICVSPPGCGMQTLSPFPEGWRCTNAMCPLRQGNRTEFQDRTWN